MKVIIAGSRNIVDYPAVLDAIKQSCFSITEVFSGGALGVDRLGERYANENNIPLRIFEAEWKKYGKGAGLVRNIWMAEHADALICVWDGKSKGSAHMQYQMISRQKPVFQYLYRGDNASEQIQDSVRGGDFSEEVCPRS